MTGFKLIAIRPLEGCHRKFLRVLKPGVLYQFYNDYTFKYKKGDPKNEVINVEYNPSIPEELYYVNSHNGKLPVNISAIVGKNGSGKSSLVELLYVAIFQIACKIDLLPQSEIENKESDLIKNFHVEIFFVVNNKYAQLIFNNDKIYIRENFKIKTAFTKDSGRNKLKSLFYTLVINYSHYSVNSKHVGDWIEKLFHKNDGYQTPIVINPFRDEGIIDINNEEYLTRSRLVVNLLRKTSTNEHRILVPNKIAESLRFKIDLKKIRFDRRHRKIEAILKMHRIEILLNVFNSMGINRTRRFFNTKDSMLRIAFDYIIKKIYTISVNYKKFDFSHYKFISENDTVEKGTIYTFNKSKLLRFLIELRKDKSHITFKLRQAINFIDNVSFYSDKIEQWIKIDDFSDQLLKVKKRNKNLIDVIPPSFFTIDIRFENGSTFDSLSSGEKQKIFGTSTLLYHLTNISSVNGKRNTKYKYVNVIFDEIELYYHPELQRTFLRDILKSLEHIDIKDIKGINFLFITHSPFILSDIPNSNILFLTETGDVDEFARKVKTFGANIHDLLKESFFLKNGYLGEYAKGKISGVIKYLNFHKFKNDNENGQLTYIENGEEKTIQEWNVVYPLDQKHKHWELINIIGEPILKIKLVELYNEVFNKDKELELLEDKIAELQMQRKILKSIK